MKALILTADHFEDSELFVPYYRFLEEGLEVDIASFSPGTVTGKHGYAVEANRVFEELTPEAYDLLCIPGGRAPAAIRGDEAVLETVRHFFLRGKPVCAICHGPQVLVSAGVLKGRRATCYRAVADEIRSAGGQYADSEVVTDGNLVTSRVPGDLPAFMREIMKLVKASRL